VIATSKSFRRNERNLEGWWVLITTTIGNAIVAMFKESMARVNTHNLHQCKEEEEHKRTFFTFTLFDVKPHCQPTGN
jgi:hypothetical protein